MNPITMVELAEIFGEHMPVTAWAIIEHALNPDDARKQLIRLKERLLWDSEIARRNELEGY